MWRWWIGGGLVVMALGVVTMAVAAPTGGPDHCIESLRYEDGRPRFDTNQVSEEFHQLFSTRSNVTIGETVRLTMTVRNTQDRRQTLRLGMGPTFLLVTTPDCRVVWLHPRGVILAGGDLHFSPHGEIRAARTWSLTDSLGELVSPGYYYVYVILKVDGDPTDGREFTRADLVVSETVWVSEAQLRAVNIMHPPTPAHPCIVSGGGPVYEAYVRQVMERRSDLLKEWRRLGAEVVDADILDENRVSTGRRGIRVVTWTPQERMSEDSPLRNLPECLDGVPVQSVVWPREYWERRIER